MMKNLLFALLSGILFASFFSCASHIRGKKLDNPYEGQEVYTRVNMRYDVLRNKGFYINYKKLTLLPANTKIRITEARSGGFIMKIPSGQVVPVFYREELEGKPMVSILKLIFSKTDVSADLSQFNEIEMKGIKIGKASVGMRKKAVIVALGYPSAQKTPSTDQDIWTYWKSRYGTYKVEFKNEKVIAIGLAGR